MQAITTEQQSALEALGYYVEDVGAVWGDEYKGQFRFMKGEDHFGDIQYNQVDAWADAHQYQAQLDERAKTTSPAFDQFILAMLGEPQKPVLIDGAPVIMQHFLFELDLSDDE